MPRALEKPELLALKPAQRAVREWRALLGADAVLDADDALKVYAATTGGEARTLAGALRPARTVDVRNIVEVARRHCVPVYPISTGHNWGYGCALPPRDNVFVLDLSRLAEIRDFDPELGTVTVEPGVTQRILAEFLARNNDAFLVPVTGAGPDCSIVGNALERGYGITPHTDHFGAVLSLEAVLADGRVYQSSLAALGAETADRSFKWGVGPYLDGLFAQSGFGIVTSMTIALARRPQAIRAFTFGLRRDDELRKAIVAIRDVVRSFPGIVGGINLMNARRVLAMAVPYPRDMIGTDGLMPDAVLRNLARKHGVAPWTVFGTLYGTQATVAAAAREIRKLVQPVASHLLFVSPETAHRVRNLAGRLRPIIREGLARKTHVLASALELVAGRPNETALPLSYWKKGVAPAAGLDPARDGCGLLWYAPLVPMTPDTVMQYIEFVEKTLRAHRMEPLITLTSLSERCFDSTVPLLFDAQSEVAVKAARRCLQTLLDEGRERGFAPYRVGIDSMSWLTSQGGTFWELARELKQAIDPQGVIAPGRYTP